MRSKGTLWRWPGTSIIHRSRTGQTWCSDTGRSSTRDWEVKELNIVTRCNSFNYMIHASHQTWRENNCLSDVKDQTTGQRLNNKRLMGDDLSFDLIIVTSQIIRQFRCERFIVFGIIMWCKWPLKDAATTTKMSFCGNLWALLTNNRFFSRLIMVDFQSLFARKP